MKCQKNFDSGTDTCTNTGTGPMLYSTAQLFLWKYSTYMLCMARVWHGKYPQRQISMEEGKVPYYRKWDKYRLNQAWWYSHWEAEAWLYHVQNRSSGLWLYRVQNRSTWVMAILRSEQKHCVISFLRWGKHCLIEEHACLTQHSAPPSAWMLGLQLWATLLGRSTDLEDRQCKSVTLMGRVEIQVLGVGGRLWMRITPGMVSFEVCVCMCMKFLFLLPCQFVMFNS